MLLRIGGPYLGYNNGDVIELDEEAGQKVLDALGADSGRVEVLGDLRQGRPPASTTAEQDEEAAFAAELAAELASDDDDS